MSRWKFRTHKVILFDSFIQQSLNGMKKKSVSSCIHIQFFTHTYIMRSSGELSIDFIKGMVCNQSTVKFNHC